MNPEVLKILDTTFYYALWAFLVGFVVIFSVAGLRLRSRRRDLEVLFENVYGDMAPEPGSRANDVDRPQFAPLRISWRTAFGSLVLSSFLAVAFFLLLAFSPFSFVDNFVRSEGWRVLPLRVTLLSHQRFHEGFSLRGEVWNQTDESIEALRALVRIWAPDQRLLDEVTIPVSPAPLPGGRAGTFQFEYREHSPFIYGYEVTFLDPEGIEIPHVKGFDVR